MIASRAARSADEVRRHNTAIDRVMTDIASDPWVLCEVVQRGPGQWTKSFVETMHAAGLPLVDDEVAARLFAFFCLRIQHLARAADPFIADSRSPKQLAAHFLDHLQVASAPKVPTVQEIAESWELESASSPSGQAFAYGGKTKDEVMRGLAGELDPTFSHDAES